MSDTTDSASPDAITAAVLELLKQPDDPVLVEAQALLARRIAGSAAIAPVRVPAPMNITEMGGYLNLLERAGENVMRLQAVSAALGLAGPLDVPTRPGGPDIGFTTVAGLRVSAAAQATAPPTLNLRADFAAPLRAVLTRLRGRGFELPLLDPKMPLPAAEDPVPDVSTMMALVGRRLRIAPSLPLRDPATDGVLVVEGGGTVAVHLRQVDAGAERAGEVAEVSVEAVTCTDSACTTSSVSVLAEPLAPALAVAGWFPGPRTPPSSLSEPGDWATFLNATGLVVGETTFGAELARLYTGSAIAASAARHVLGAVWSGTAFELP